MLHIWDSLAYLTNGERYNTFYIFRRLCFSTKFIYWLRNLLPQHADPVSILVDEKLKLLHAIQGAIAEKTASLLSAHFHRYISAHHTTLFPHFIHRLPSDYAPAARRWAIRNRHSYLPSPAAAPPLSSQSSDFADVAISFDSLSSHSSSTAPTFCAVYWCIPIGTPKAWSS
jgi:hypothetical protein